MMQDSPLQTRLHQTHPGRFPGIAAASHLLWPVPPLPPQAGPTEPCGRTVDDKSGPAERPEYRAGGLEARLEQAEPGAEHRGDIYTMEALLQLRAIATGRPDDATLALLRGIHLLKSCHGDDDTQAERHQIPRRVLERPNEGVVAWEDHVRRPETPYRCLSRPSRLSLRQTKQAEIRAAAARTSTLKIGHLNVRSLTAHLDEVNQLLQTERLDLLCLGETWLTDAVDSCMLVLPGYVISRQDRPTKKTGGGVAIIHRCTMTVERLRVPASRSTLESLWLHIIGRTTITIGVAYRPLPAPRLRP